MREASVFIANSGRTRKKGRMLKRRKGKMKVILERKIRINSSYDINS